MYNRIMSESKLIKVGIENNFEGRSLAWVLDHPGCFAYGSNETEALVRVPQALVNYKNWLDGYTGESWLKDLGDFDIRLVEVFEDHFLDDQFQPAKTGKGVGAWFHQDWQPLRSEEIEKGLSILAWGHQDLFELTANLNADFMDKTWPEERWSIRGILLHVAGSELFYLNRLSLTSIKSQDLPRDGWQSLQISLNIFQESMRQMVGVEDVRGKDGEFWSPRKVLRRGCWHVLDHCQHIHRLITSQLQS
jgi:hypothetical protein